MHARSRTLLVVGCLIAVFGASLGASRAQAAGLELGVTAPVVVPLGYETSFGAGICANLQLDLNDWAGLSLTSGVLRYVEDENHSDAEVPILLGGTFSLPTGVERVRPYLDVKLGYTHAFGSDRTPHWLTAMVGGGVRISTADRLDVIVGADFVVPDIRGNSDDKFGLMLKLGAQYGVL
jgi:hypothetical protein